MPTADIPTIPIYSISTSRGGANVNTVEPVTCKNPRQTFPIPTNSTPLFQIDETPYKKVDTRRAVADMFTDATEAKDNENAIDLNSAGLILNTQAGIINAGNALTWPRLKGEGLNIIQLKLPPCTVGLPHYHGVNEVAYVSRGSNAVVGIKESNKPLNMIKNVQAGSAVFLPKLAIHFLMNLNCNEDLEGVQIFASDKHTTMQVHAGTMALPSEVLQATYNTDIDLIEIMKSTELEELEVFRLGPHCLKRCGLQ